MEISFLFREILKNLSGQSKKVKIEDLSLKNLISDHRKIKNGDLFVAIRGNTFDGHSVLSEVTKKNPLAIVLEDSSTLPQNYSGSIFEVVNSRRALDILANALTGFPTDKLFCVGITGTNGKTTTSHLVEYALDQKNIPTGVIGTIDHHFIDTQKKRHVWPTSLTTPGSIEFYERLCQFLDLGAKALSVEVSSHALEQDRMSSCQFDGAIFTNLTQDHLDYHKTMEKYFLAKQKLFSDILKNSKKKNKFAVIYGDDPYGRKLVIPEGIRPLYFGTQNADITYQILEQSFGGQKILVQYGKQKYDGHVHLCGAFNVQNILAAAGVLIAQGESLQAALGIFEEFRGVRGRLEKIRTKSLKNVFVDYAHTPDALKNVLQTLRVLKNHNKIISVFGCGGDRDQAKRSLMGEIACQLSDHVILTSDNPRTEDPQKIIQDIVQGCHSFSNYEVVIDRKNAIFKALNLANDGDAILIAGKGHEDYQIIGTQKHHFDDAEVVREILA